MGSISPAAPTNVIVPVPEERVRFCAPLRVLANSMFPTPAPVSIVVEVVKVVAPSEIEAFEELIVPARLIVVGAVAVSPPEKVMLSPASFPRVTVPVLSSVVLPAMVEVCPPAFALKLRLNALFTPTERLFVTVRASPKEIDPPLLFRTTVSTDEPPMVMLCAPVPFRVSVVVPKLSPDAPALFERFPPIDMA